MTDLLGEIVVIAVICGTVVSCAALATTGVLMTLTGWHDSRARRGAADGPGVDLVMSARDGALYVAAAGRPGAATSHLLPDHAALAAWTILTTPNRPEGH